jgi:WD40 repeat protein
MAYDIESGDRLYWSGNGLRLRTIDVSPDGERLAVGLTEDGTVRIINAMTGELMHTLEGHTHWVQVVAFSPDGNYLASGSDDGRLLLWDPQSGKLLRSLYESSGWIWSVTFSPDGHSLIAGFNLEFKYRVWETQSWTLINTFDGDQASDIDISPDGRKLVSASDGWHEVNLWDLSTGSHIFTLKGHPSWIWAVAFSPDGKTVASGGIGDVIILWAVQTGQPVKEFYTRVDFIQSLEFSPNGASLASVGANGEVLLWPVQ